MAIVKLQEILDLFKSADRREYSANPLDGYLIMQDAAMGVLVHSWRRLIVHWDGTREAEAPLKVTSSTWNLLWEVCEWSMEDLVTISGLEPDSMIVAWERAKACRYIYPDGTIPVTIQKLLEAQLYDRLLPTSVKEVKRLRT